MFYLITAYLKKELLLYEYIKSKNLTPQHMNYDIYFNTFTNTLFKNLS